MRALLLVALLAGIPQDPADALWKQLDGDEAAARKSAFEEPRKASDAPTQTRLKKAAQPAAAGWMKKAAAERSRALRAATASSRKGFNPVEFAARQKEMLGM